jgi:hypothetical protein
VVASGITEQYEWLVALDPYPLTPGFTVITLLVYDSKTYQPVTDLQAELYLAPPDSPRPCCQAGVHIGPLKLDTDPALFPGDYSTVVEIIQTGAWEAKFLVSRGGQQPLEAAVSFQVQAGSAANAPTPGSGAVDAAATATSFAQNVATARQTPVGGVSPLSSPLVVSMLDPAGAAQPVSPLAANVASSASLSGAQRIGSPFGANWWLWGVLSLAPIALIFVWALRPKDEERP